MHVNLLPASELQRRTFRRVMRRWVRAWTAAAALIAMIVYWQQVRYNHLNGAVARTIEQTSHLRALQGEVTLIAGQLATVEQRISQVLRLIPTDNTLVVCDQLCQGVRATDGMVQLIELRIVPVVTGPKDKPAPSTVLVGGMAVHDQAISKFISTLRDSALFAEVKLQASSQVGVPGGSARRFQLQCLYRSEP